MGAIENGRLNLSDVYVFPEALGTSTLVLTVNPGYTVELGGRKADRAARELGAIEVEAATGELNVVEGDCATGELGVSKRAAVEDSAGEARVKVVKTRQHPGVRVVCVSSEGSLRPAVRMAGPITRRKSVNTPSSSRLARIGPHAIGH